MKKEISNIVFEKINSEVKWKLESEQRSKFSVWLRYWVIGQPITNDISYQIVGEVLREMKRGEKD